jgi:hypothetical protein
MLAYGDFERTSICVALRRHPRMIWQGQPNWPPVWNGPHGPNNPLPLGEVGILTRVETRVSGGMAPHCVLVMRWKDQDYFGSLLFDDSTFFERIVGMLRRHIGLSIAEIGNLIIPDKQQD